MTDPQLGAWIVSELDRARKFVAALETLASFYPAPSGASAPLAPSAPIAPDAPGPTFPILGKTPPPVNGGKPAPKVGRKPDPQTSEIRLAVEEVLVRAPSIGLPMHEIKNAVRANGTGRGLPAESFSKRVETALQILNTAKKIERNGVNWRMRNA